MSNTAPNEEELSPAGLRRNRLTLAFRSGQREGQAFQKLLQDSAAELDSKRWAKKLATMGCPPPEIVGEDCEAWRAGFRNGRSAERGSGELAPSPYEDARGAAKK